MHAFHRVYIVFVSCFNSFAFGVRFFFVHLLILVCVCLFLLNLICDKRIEIVFNFCLLFSLGFEFLNNKLASFYLIAILLMWTGSMMWFSRLNNVTVVCTQYPFRMLHISTDSLSYDDLAPLPALHLNLIVCFGFSYAMIVFFFLFIFG